MRCAACQARLVDFVHDELDPAVRAELGEHLTRCPDCALEYCRLDLDLAGIERAHGATPRPPVHDALRRRVAREFAPWWRRAWSLWTRPVPAYGIAAALVVPAVLWGLARPLLAPPPPTPASTADAEPTERAVSERAGRTREPTIRHYDGSLPTRIDPRLL
jgi:hypothetical protein